MSMRANKGERQRESERVCQKKPWLKFITGTKIQNNNKIVGGKYKFKIETKL